MIYGGKTQAETEADCGMGRLQIDGVMLGADFDSDDEDLGLDLMAATPPTHEIHPSFWWPNRGKAKKPKENTHTILSNRHTKMSDTNRLFDWVLGRRSYWTPEDPINNTTKTRQRKHEPEIDDDYTYIDIGDVNDICPACGTSYHQAIDSTPFKSSLKLMYNDAESQKWLIGNKYTLHEAVDTHPDDAEVPLVEASRALHKLAPDVPAPRVRAGWKDSGRVIAITDAAPTGEGGGERLYDIWWDLTPAERDSVAAQVARHVSSWRETDLGRISNLTGGPVHTHTNLFGRYTGGGGGDKEKGKEVGFGPFGSDLELWNSIESRLRTGVDEDTIALLRSRMPASSPCVLTHGDLSSANIIVARKRRKSKSNEDEAVEVLTIQGFENAASLPVWAEGVALHLCYCKEDEQWKALLSGHLPARMKCPAALDWWNLWRAVEETALTVTPPKAWDLLEERCRRWRETEILGLPFWAAKLDGAGEPVKRLNIQRAEDEAETHVEELLRQAMESDIRDEVESLGGSSSWGSSMYDDEEGDVAPKPGLVPYHEIQQQHHALLASANEPPGPPGHVIEAWRRDSRRKSVVVVEPLSPSSRDPIIEMMRRHSIHPVWAEGSLGAPSPRSGADKEQQEDELETPRPPRTKGGLRPLSLPSIAMLANKMTIAEDNDDGEGAIAAVAIAGSSSSQQQPEKGQSGNAKNRRTSIFKNHRAAPGQLYAVLSAAQARRHERSRSEGRARLEGDEAEELARVRRRSMMQPTTPLFG